VHARSLDGVAQRLTEQRRIQIALAQIVLRAELQGADAKLSIIVTSEHENRHVADGARERCKGVQAGCVGELEVEKDGVEAPLTDFHQSSVGASGAMEIVVIWLGRRTEILLDQPRVDRVVLDEQHLEGSVRLDRLGGLD
jgi:hypothetical protein